MTEKKVLRGRPPKPPGEGLGDSAISVYFDEAGMRAVKRAARVMGQRESAWCRDMLLPIAKAVLRAYQAGYEAACTDAKSLD